MKNEKRNISATVRCQEYEEEIMNFGGISLLMKEHENGLEFRILSVDMEELIAAAAKEKKDEIKNDSIKKND